MKPFPSTSRLSHVARPAPSSCPASRPTLCSSVPPSISTSAATAGMNAMATAGAWRGGDATKACAVISSPMKIRMGATAASSRSATRSGITPSAAPSPMTRPVASV